VELEVRRVRELLKSRDHAGALRAAEALAVQVPENRDVLYLIAVSRRFLGEIPEALQALERLEQLHPRFSRLYQERGHCFVALKDAPQAIDAFLRGGRRLAARREHGPRVPAQARQSRRGHAAARPNWD
jgi:hypothetical protein